MRRSMLIGIVMALGLMGAVSAEHEHPTGPGSAELERVKQLAGRWEGTAGGDGHEAEPAVVEYKVTSGGSAVVETLAPGTPKEMVSVYHDRDGKLSMTHYCMLRNQPELALTQATETQMNFSLREGSGLDPASTHMHQLAITWNDSDHITQTWTGYEAGQPKESITMTLSRVK